MSIYQHFRPEEHLFIDHVLAWKKEVEQSYRMKLTDFLDPREQQILSMLVGTNQDDFELHFHGGGMYTERKRAVICPFYEDVDFSSFDLVLLEATFHQKFISLTHRDVMGAFLSLGIERKKLGDIFIEDNHLQIITTADIATYVEMNLTKIKNASIKLTTKPFKELLEKEANWISADHTISSLRLDNVIKEIYRISRSESANLIKKKLVKVNFRVVEDAAYPLFEGDLLSVRGKGRSKLVAIHGKTKKDKFRVTSAILK